MTKECNFCTEYFYLEKKSALISFFPQKFAWLQSRKLGVQTIARKKTQMKRIHVWLLFLSPSSLETRSRKGIQ